MSLSEPQLQATPPATRSGYVTLAGRPNAGKSTLLNALLGERLSIVTARPQTTWRRITGILTTDTVQVVFLDTPGLLEPRDLLQRSMLAAALEAISEADVVLMVLDAARPFGTGPRRLLAEAVEPARGRPLLAAVNKIDVALPDRRAELARWAREELGAEVLEVSALTEEGVELLGQRLRELLPRGPFLFPEDEIAQDPLRFFAAEMVRETVYEEFRQEIPYSVFCQVEEFREDQDPLYILANLFVERKSQKGILLGRGGSSIRVLGERSREKLEEFLGRRVFLDLWVKVLPNWRRKRSHLKRLGFSVPERDFSRDGR